MSFGAWRSRFAASYRAVFPEIRPKVSKRFIIELVYLFLRSRSALILPLLWQALALAQTCPAVELRVFVKDSQTAPIFDAQVKLASKDINGASRQTQTSGVADFDNVACGIWTVRAAKPGFDEGMATVQMNGKPGAQVTLVLHPQSATSSLDVTETAAPPVEQSSSVNNELRPAEVKILPSNPPTVTDALPLVPGVVRASNGELKIDGSGEERSGLVVNQSDVTDPATGRFGQTLPIDSIESLNVLNTPFLAQYGRFTQSVVAVETRRGGDKWHADLNDPFPDFRIRSYHMIGVKTFTPRFVFGGPLIRDKLFFITAFQYFVDKVQNQTLSFPQNVSKTEWLNSFTQFDYLLSARQILNVTFHANTEHTNVVNPDYFNPPPVTPNFAQHNYVGTFAHHLGFLGGTLESSFALQRFDVRVGSQGDNEMTLAPEGNSGSYFGKQQREAWRKEWLEIWSPSPAKLLGTHLVKLGTSLTWAGNTAEFIFSPVNIVDETGLPLQRIDFTNQGLFTRNDLEFTAYGQDHWALNSKFALDYGLRIEHQRLASSLRVAPRAGFAWTPFENQRTVVRAGWGEFYDHIPLDVYSFSRYPIRTITNYARDGSVVSGPTEYENVIGSATGPKTFLVKGQRVAGAFSPRGASWNAQVEHSFSRLFRVRGVYLDNRSVGLIVLEPDLVDDTHKVVLNGDGSSRYRQAEVTGKFVFKDEQSLVLAYTRSRAEGSLNAFDTFLGNFPSAVLRPDVYSNLAGDLPNRFLVWGRLSIPFWSLKLMPVIEYRNGFPYTKLDARQDYVGVPNGDATRFPNFLSVDARLMRDFRVNQKATLRLSVSGFNLTNHFNALAVHNNIADPRCGIFFGNYHRRYRFDFEVIF
jgi:hypothetical protein